MLIDLKIKNPKDIKKGSILISNDGKVFEVVQSNVLSKVYENENTLLKKRMLNLENDMKNQREEFKTKMNNFILSFTKGGRK